EFRPALQWLWLATGWRGASRRAPGARTSLRIAIEPGQVVQIGGPGDPFRHDEQLAAIFERLLQSQPGQVSQRSEAGIGGQTHSKGPSPGRILIADPEGDAANGEQYAHASDRSDLFYRKRKRKPGPGHRRQGELLKRVLVVAEVDFERLVLDAA